MKSSLRPYLVAGSLITSVLGGCAADITDSIAKPVGDKADAVARLCRDAGEPDDCDICAVRDWYDDGECDDFCATPDGDCATPAPEPVALEQYECTWGDHGPFGEDGNDLYDNAVSVGTYESPEDVSGLLAQQIFAAAYHLAGGFMSPDASLDEAFESVDENTYYVSEVTVDRARFDWLKAYAGDTQVGVVFEAGTTKIVAEISDGDVMACELAPSPEVPEPGAYQCHWETPHPLAADFSSSGDLYDRAHHVATYNGDQMDAIPALRLRQFFVANAVANGVPEGAGFAEAFEMADERTFQVRSLYHGSVFYTWIHFYSGDTEVGAIFERSSEAPLVVIGDGDLLGCAPADG